MNVCRDRSNDRSNDKSNDRLNDRLNDRANNLDTVKPLITNSSKELIKCRILHFLIMECCRYLLFFIK